jgi:gamma-glutamylputrescine oxidase
VLDYPSTYYAATLTHDGRWPRLVGHHEAEVCVIGGGLAGVATALALAEQRRSVVLLEACRVGWGASGRNGGFVSPGYPASMLSLNKRLGEQAALALWRLSTDAVETVRQRATKLSPGVFAGTGGLTCRIAGHPDTLRAYVTEMNERFNAGLVVVPKEALREIVVTDHYVDGYSDPTSFLVHPLNLVRGMAKEATKLGARFHEGARARAVCSNKIDHVVTTDRGSVRAKHVVLSGGAYIGFLHRPLAFATVPIASFVIATKPMPEYIGAFIRTKAGISDTRLIPDYYRVLPEGRLLWGGRASSCQPNIERLKRLLHQDMTRIYPELSNVAVDLAWGGLMSFARHRMPIIARISDGIWVASAFGGHGLGTTTLAGTLIAAAITDGDDRYRYFAPFGLSFAGGPLLGRPAVQLIVWRQRIADWLERLHHSSSG